MSEIIKSKLPILVGIVLLAIILVNQGISFQCRRTYDLLLSNTKIIEAFYDSDQVAIDSVVKDEDLAYQHIIEGKVKYSSQPWLPTPDIINYQQSFADDVLVPSPTESLRSQLPYRIRRGFSIYVMSPICTKDCFSEMFIVYKRQSYEKDFRTKIIPSFAFDNYFLYSRSINWCRTDKF